MGYTRTQNQPMRFSPFQSTGVCHMTATLLSYLLPYLHKLYTYIYIKILDTWTHTLKTQDIPSNSWEERSLYPLHPPRLPLLLPPSLASLLHLLRTTMPQPPRAALSGWLSWRMRGAPTSSHSWPCQHTCQGAYLYIQTCILCMSYMKFDAHTHV